MGICERIKDEIEIADYARYLGFSLKKVGNYYTLKEHDSVMISPKKRKYWQNSNPSSGKAIGEGGSVIDFAMNFGGLSLNEAIKELISFGNIRFEEYSDSGYVVKKASTQKEKTPLQLPEADTNMKKVYAYLTQTRKISVAVVKDIIARKMLYQDTYGNCVFVGYDIMEKDKPVFGCKRGTNTYKKFLGDVSGCDYTKGFYLDNLSKRIIVTESVIDAMSIMSLLSNYRNYNYLALGGTGKYEALRYYLDNQDVEQVIIALDNDEGGIRGAVCICNLIRTEYPTVKRKWKLPPKNQGKDWNELLKR